jgi:hypothetical protein
VGCEQHREPAEDARRHRGHHPGGAPARPLGITGLASAGRHAPVTVRLALHDLARYRARSGAALAAVTFAVLVAVLTCILATARFADPVDYFGPNLPANQLVVHAPDGTPGCSGTLVPRRPRAGCGASAPAWTRSPPRSGALALLGAVLGTAVAYLAAIAWYRSSLASTVRHVPVGDLVVILAGLPLAATAGGWLFAGREPPAIARQPLE